MWRGARDIGGEKGRVRGNKKAARWRDANKKWVGTRDRKLSGDRAVIVKNAP